MGGGPDTEVDESTIQWWEKFDPSIAEKLKQPPVDDSLPMQKFSADAELPSPDETGKLMGITEKDIQETLNDPQKRLEAMSKWKVPQFSDAYKNDTDESRFLDNLKSGTEKAQQYLDYVNKTVEYVEKYGDFTGSDKIKSAAAGLQRITKKLDEGLGKVGKRINRVKQIIQWVSAMDSFASATIDMDLKDRESVRRWVDSMKSLWNATSPFAEWAHDKAAVAAIAEGSEVAATFSAVFAIVGAQLYLGLNALDVGLKNVNAYLARYEKIMREIDKQSGHGPQPPAYPGDDWASREEQAYKARGLEDTELRTRIYDAKRGEVWKAAQEREKKIKEAEDAKAKAAAEREKAIQKASNDFDQTLFPQIYMKHRASIQSQILKDLRKTKGGDDESDWWDCLTPDESKTLPKTVYEDGSDSDERFYDKQAQMIVYPVKSRITASEAQTEIRKFKNTRRACPYVDQLYSAEYKAHMAKAVAAIPAAPAPAPVSK